MGWGIGIAIALGVLAAMTAGLAGHLASTKQWHKWVFWSCGIVMVALIAIQSIINARTEAHLQEKVDNIWSFLNTNPVRPKVQVQPPKLPNRTLSETSKPEFVSHPKSYASRSRSGVGKNEAAMIKSESISRAESVESLGVYHGSIAPLKFPPSNGVLKIVSQTQVTSTRSDAPYEIEIIVQSSVVWNSLRLALQCNGDLVEGDAMPPNGGMQVKISEGLAHGHPNIFLFEYGSATPPLGPADPLKILIWSKEPVSCTEVAAF